MNVRDTTRKKINLQRAFYIDKPILLIEDQASLMHMLTKLLVSTYGVEIHAASNYAQAKAYLSKHRHEYHLAICDLNLPDAPNGEVVDLISRAKVSMIALTGSFGESMRATMLDKGVVDYINKGTTNAYAYVVELVGRLYQNYSSEVLIVDDSATSRKVMREMLALQNFVVLEAENGVEALAITEKNPNIQLVLTDYHMPEMDGFNLTLALRKTRQKEELAIIGLSATGHSDLGSQFIKNGANDFLVKPVAYEELLCRVNQNITMLEHMEALRFAANCDFLTGLFNRRYFFNRGTELYQQAKQSKQFMAVAMLDIDHFKQVNDTYGHEVGDDLLVYFSSQLKQQFTDELIARIGGEEFVILFHQPNNLSVAQQLECFRENIATTVVNSHEHAISMSVSIGLHHDYENSLDAMLNVADKKLYQAKSAGRNRVVE